MVPILVYDGDCGFCTASARWIAARWTPGAARLATSASLSDSELAAHGLTRADVADAAWWIDGDGRAVAGDRAIAAALHSSTGWSHLAGRLLTVPGISALAPGAYRIVARNRHRLPGSTAACAAPTSVSG